MRRSIRLWGWLAALALLSAAADAQVVIRRFGAGGGGGMGWLDAAPAQFGVSAWHVGEWARYSVSENLGGGMPMVQFRTVSVVGQRGDGYWVETADEFGGMAAGKGPTRKLLVPFGPIAERVGAEGYVMAPDSSVRRQTLVRDAGRAAGRPRFPEGWTRAGDESVTTSGGTFHATRWRKSADELWTSAEAGPLGLVRFRSADVEVELVGHAASGARSQIPFGGSER